MSGDGIVVGPDDPTGLFQPRPKLGGKGLINSDEASWTFRKNPMVNITELPQYGNFAVI